MLSSCVGPVWLRPTIRLHGVLGRRPCGRASACAWGWGHRSPTRRHTSRGVRPEADPTEARAPYPSGMDTRCAATPAAAGPTGRRRSRRARPLRPARPVVRRGRPRRAAAGGRVGLGAGHPHDGAVRRAPPSPVARPHRDAPGPRGLLAAALRPLPRGQRLRSAVRTRAARSTPRLAPGARRDRGGLLSGHRRPTRRRGLPERRRLDPARDSGRVAGRRQPAPATPPVGGDRRASPPARARAGGPGPRGRDGGAASDRPRAARRRGSFDVGDRGPGGCREPRHRHRPDGSSRRPGGHRVDQPWCAHRDASDARGAPPGR